MDRNVTIYWDMTTAVSDQELTEAASLLQSGETVAFPTETVYGLGADAGSDQAVRGIFAAKGRPSDNPLIVHIADLAQLEALVAPGAMSEGHRQLMAAFWPGPLTLVLPVREGSVSPLVTAGLPTVGVRMPDHPLALRLLRAAGCPVAAPSANRSGRPSPTTAAHVRADLDGRIGGLLDGGATGVGVESTVVERVGDDWFVLRPGGVTVDALRRALPGAAVHEPARGSDAEPVEAPRAPGMKYAHYAPQGRMRLVQGDVPEQVAAWIQRELDVAAARGETVGVLTYAEHADLYRADCVQVCGSLAEPASIARGLYVALRRFDEAGIAQIWAEACPETGLGLAIMNRLRKAAAHDVVRL
ncbi:threonylcarbamoyl-AMP synthase [Paenibacillus athensensis]|uniref:Threonylcarbamoyl-AMP synthase n=1 Tax=Paenibacillus athensensis TaxID=1967502 RepID=A0A4Y8Q488_9BACL|nr:L-threonylcarbamoyladenylate synthase [Paenibacillus athensensis]MCD1260908.1 threonylcarbamoyl-AMP synthase [Paenibacillus athensensis]